MVFRCISLCLCFTTVPFCVCLFPTWLHVGPASDERSREWNSRQVKGTTAAFFSARFWSSGLCGWNDLDEGRCIDVSWLGHDVGELGQRLGWFGTVNEREGMGSRWVGMLEDEGRMGFLGDTFAGG